MNPEDLDLLLVRYLDGNLTPDEVETLNRCLAEDAEGRALLREMASQAVMLNDLAREQEPIAPAPAQTVPPSKPGHGRPRRKLHVFAIAAILVLCTLPFVLVRRDSPVSASIRATPGTIWEFRQGGIDAAGGGFEPDSLLVVERGHVEAQLSVETRVILNGPAEMEISNPEALRLQTGTLWVRSSHQGFTVDTPRMRIVDLGTEFGVMVLPGRDEEIHVGEGRVRAISPTREQPALEIASGKAVRTCPLGLFHEATYDKTRFRTTLPEKTTVSTPTRKDPEMKTTLPALALLSLPFLANAQSERILDSFRAVNGPWAITGQAADVRSGSRISIAESSREITGDYVLSFAFTRTAGTDSVSAILPVGNTQCTLEFSGWGGQAHGLSRVDGRSVKDPANPTGVRPGSLENGKKYQVSVAVKVEEPKASIAATLDGAPLIQYAGALDTLKPNRVVRLQEMNRIGLAVGGNTSARFEDLVLRTAQKPAAKSVVKKPETPAAAPASVKAGEVNLKQVRFAPVNGTISTKAFQGEDVLHLKGNESVAFLPGAEMADGVIECDIASETFSGLAFRGAGLKDYEYLYLRPFNSGTAKHKNTVQYSSHGVPGGNWSALRSKFPGKYEAGADIKKSEWFHLKLEIRGETVKAFVNNAPEPVLVVDKMLGGRATGSIGIWGWDSYFKNFEFKPSGK